MTTPRISRRVSAAIATSLLAVGTLLAVSPGATATSPDTRGEVSPMIVGGQPVQQGRYPWMAYLHINMANSSWFCGGSLVSPDIILTAAHCVRASSVGKPSGEFRNLTASIGHVRWRDAANNGLAITSTRTVLGGGLGSGDWAVVKLDRPVQLKKYPAINATDSRNNGPRFDIIGWGNTQPTTVSPSDVLLGVTLPAVPNNQCSMSNESEFCAGTYGQSNCRGDSGGPVMNRGVITGLVSWQVGCGNVRDEPGHYTRVSRYANDIQSAIRQLGGQQARIASPGETEDWPVGSMPQPQPTTPTPDPVPTTTRPTPQPTTPQPTTPQPTTPQPTTPQPTQPNPGGDEFSNKTSMPLNDMQTARSEITSSKVGSKRVTVNLDVNHPCLQNLGIAITTPDGTRNVVKRASASYNCAAWSGVKSETYPLNSQSDGQWILEMSDEFRGNTGTLNGWSIKFS